jgi:phage gpG-like protein
MGKINIDLNKLNSVINKAFDVVVEAQGEAFQNALVSNIWEWPRETLRQNGDLVSSPRDIYDTGELYDSLVISRTSNAAEYTWESDYAAIVHDGATTKNGTELPARPWTKVGIEECDAAEIMQKQLNKLL